ncbi:MAG: malate dehydrogenase [Myxococcales bacterium]|nr:malate dehydrogenase [Myxococcales bacterium]
MSRRNKITIVGAGNVGATAAHWAVQKHLGDVVLVDIKEGMPQGKALDLAEASPVMGFDCTLTGSNSYDATAGSDVVVITAGVPRRKDPKTGKFTSRDELVEINRKIVGSVTREVVKRSPDAVLICVANPLDAMCHVMYHESGFPKERVIGMAGVLDTARYKFFISEALGVSVDDIHGMVLGGHGDTMVPLPRYSSMAGVPVTELLPEEKIAAIVKRTQGAGGEIVALLKTGSAYYSPSAAAVQMAESIIKDKKRILPCAVYLQGEYGYNGHFLGVPCKLGAGGMLGVVEIELSEAERAALDKSYAAVVELSQICERMM